MVQWMNGNSTAAALQLQYVITIFRVLSVFVICMCKSSLHVKIVFMKKISFYIVLFYMQYLKPMVAY